MGETPKMVGFPQSPPQVLIIFRTGKPMEIVGETHHFRKHPIYLPVSQEKYPAVLPCQEEKMTSTQAPMFIPLPPGLADLRSSTASIFARSCAAWWVFAGGARCCDWCWCWWSCSCSCYCYMFLLFFVLLWLLFLVLFIDSVIHIFYLALCYRVIAVVISVFVASFVAPAVVVVVVVANIEKRELCFFHTKRWI